MTGHLKDNYDYIVYTLTCHNISKRFAAGCYFERAPTNQEMLERSSVFDSISFLQYNLELAQEMGMNPHF